MHQIEGVEDDAVGVIVNGGLKCLEIRSAVAFREDGLPSMMAEWHGR
jgi:hypothetical protein